MSSEKRPRVLRLEIQLESDNELEALQGALLAARASELTRAKRRGDRHGFGYGSDSARETMLDEVDQARERVEMLDRLLAAIERTDT
jgi:hypothetical protein